MKTSAKNNINVDETFTSLVEMMLNLGIGKRHIHFMKSKKSNIIHKIFFWNPVVIIAIMFVLGACTGSASANATTTSQPVSIADDRTETFISIEDTVDDDNNSSEISEDKAYTSKEDVAAYIHRYKKLPSNYISKKEAEDKGWITKECNLWEVCPGKSIGGSSFGNYENKLPKKDGRKYYECDIDYDGGYRNAKRIIYSNDGMIYYTEDHYETFEKLY